MSNGKYYTGSTNNIDRRFEDHSHGKVQSTKPYRPLQLLYTKEYSIILEARQVEYRLKKMKDRSYIDRFISGDLQW